MNLPATEKLIDAAWRDVPAGEMPGACFDGGVATGVVGSAAVSGQELAGWLPGARVSRPAVVEVRLKPGARYQQSIAAQDNALV